MERDEPVWPVEKPTKRSTSRNTLKATTSKEVIISATYVGNIAGQETPFKSTCQQTTDNHNDIHNDVYPNFDFSAHDTLSSSTSTECIKQWIQENRNVNVRL